MSRIGRAAVMSGEKFEIREYPVPDPEPGSILLKQELAGICGTDLHNWEYQRLRGEIILGHENVGIIDSLGSGVETDYLGNPIAPGDRVLFAPGTNKGAYGFIQAEEAPYLRGGFGEYIYLWNPDSVVLKTDMPAEVAVITEPFTIGVHGAMRSGLQFGDTVVVQGSGAIGLLTLVAAKVSGAGRLIMVGGPKGRLELAERLGADLTIDIADIPDPEERTKIVRENTPEAQAPMSSLNAQDFCPPFPKASHSCGTAALMSPWDILSMWDLLTATPTRCLCAATCASKPCGQARPNTLCAHSPSSNETNTPLPTSSATPYPLTA